MTSSLIPINTNLNIVVDTNQFLSVFVFHGKLMRLVFDLVIDEKIHLYVSLPLKDEVREKLQFFAVSKEGQKEVLSFIEDNSIIVEPTISIDVCRDKEDNFALELAEASQADYLITRDKALLTLKNWKQTEVINPEDFLPLLRKMKLID
jgi:putative PIN family toxin of toxin-antitoxin system